MAAQITFQPAAEPRDGDEKVRRFSYLVPFLILLALAGCNGFRPASQPPPAPAPAPPPPSRDFTSDGDVRDSVYLPVDRKSQPPDGYGLYTVLLSRTSDRKTIQVLTEILRTTGSAIGAPMAKPNLNLITLPVNNAADASRALSTARNEPGGAAAELIQKHYDFGQAALLISDLCRSDRASKNLCGSGSPDGPMLVTMKRPLGGSTLPGQWILVVNLARTNPQAVPEVLATYRRQITTKDWPHGSPAEKWRLDVLNQLLDAADLLPGITKVYAVTK